MNGSYGKAMKNSIIGILFSCAAAFSAMPALAASPYDGQWEDSVSGRCHLTAETAADGVTRFEVRWADSASDDNVWTFSGRWKKEKLEFSDCSHALESTYDQGKETVKVTYRSGKGTVSIRKGRLFWDNAADNVCRDCSFEKVE